jgi:hypothetical protein
MVITAAVDIDPLYDNRKTGAATTFNDRIRRAPMYQQYPPYKPEKITAKRKMPAKKMTAKRGLEAPNTQA